MILVLLVLALARPIWGNFNHVFLPRCKFDEDIIKSEQKLKKEISQADFVFTGKVNGDIEFLDNSTIHFDVFVKRYFKARDFIGGNNKHEVSVIKTLYEGEGVKCRQILRSRYTAIFIGRKLENTSRGDLALTINPVPVTLTNLDRVSAATKGEIRHVFDGNGLGSLLHASVDRDEGGGYGLISFGIHSVQ